MFSGIITNTGVIRHISINEGLISFETDLATTLAIGDSIAVNGICLTVIELDNALVSVEVMPETVKRTNLGNIKENDLVNLELPLTLNDIVSGHLVSGHIDTTARILAIEIDDNAHMLTLKVEDEKFMRYIAEKGSVTLDGISLTVIEVELNTFTVGIIPHTWETTNFIHLKKGNILNVETDLLAKYIERQISIDTYS